MSLSWLSPTRLLLRVPSDAAQTVSIREQAAQLRSLSDAQLKQRTTELRQLATDAARLLPAFALMCEAIRRTQGLELYEVQLLGGLAMAAGNVAEMQTGEGKTLTASLPAFFYSLAGQGVHVATPNAYLAQRDWQCLKPAFQIVGCSTGLLPEQGSVDEKRAAYACDVTYATGYALGFDYLRDRLELLAGSRLPLGVRHRRLLSSETTPARPLQRRLACAILDEIDSVLLDEACTPLVLADAAQQTADDVCAHQLAQRLADTLRCHDDYQLDLSQRQVTFTDAGMERIHAHLASRATGPLLRPWAEYVRQALFAEHLLTRDVDYVVADDRVLLVDEFTGRIFRDRSWQDGLHQAVEMKEGLICRAPQRTLARITRQRFFRQYATVCGMTGTASTSRREFQRQYGLHVVTIPPARPSQRRELPDRYFVSTEAKLRAIVRDTAERQACGQPVLLGTRTIQSSLQLAEDLAEAGVAFRLLNGCQDQAEAEIIARAGERAAVTLATNMAGRGTDIRLARDVTALGGLHVIGVERQESQRVDRQLAGRAARQGDPGSCQFFLSADDLLIRRFSPRLGRRMAAARHDHGELHVDYSRPIAAAQRKAESLAAHARRRLVLFDDWLST